MGGALSQKGPQMQHSSLTKEGSSGLETERQIKAKLSVSGRALSDFHDLLITFP